MVKLNKLNNNKDINFLDSRIKYENDNRIESGRSMVEMLGVLAVVGVLSIGGIMGYSYGMDKYRANEATNQIMLRAIDLMTQAGNNNETLSFASWNNEASQYDFGTPEYTNDGLIVFDVGTNEKMPKRICEMVYDNMKDMAFQIDINAVRADSNDACGDDNEMTFYFEGGIGATCDPACPEGQYCDNGICFKGGVPEGTSLVGKACTTTADCNVGWTGTCAVCSSGYNDNSCLFSYYNRKSCTLNDGTPGLCNEGQCIPKGCTSNADCTEPGTYCASTNSSTEMRFQAGETGSCVPVNFIRKETNKETYYISNDLISWWDAEYACAAIGQNIKLLNIDELISDWDGELGYYSKTQLAEELYNIIGGYTIWTQNLAGNSAFVVDLMDGSVYRDSLNYSQRNIGSPIAVCRSY